MNQIDNITDDASQVTSPVLDDGSVVTIALRFLPAIERWVMDVAYGEFTANNLAVVVSPNMLRQWSATLPFGLACLTSNGIDPINVDDFQNGNASLFVLTADEVATLEAEVFEAVP